MLCVVCCILISSVLSAQINPNLERFWIMIGQGYEDNNMDLLVKFHGSSYEKNLIKNPFPNVDDRDKVWKIVYPGGEFYYYELYRTGNSFLVYWFITPDFVLPKEYRDIFSLSLQGVRSFFGREYRWLNEETAGHGVPSGDIFFHYNDNKELIKIDWAAEFP